MKYIVDFNDQAEASQIDSYFVTHGCEVLEVFDTVSNTYLVSSDAVPPSSEIVDFIIEDETSQIDLKSVPRTQNIEITSDERWWLPVVLSDVDLDDEQATIYRGGKGTSIYLLDSGIQGSHAEFINSNIRYVSSVVEDDYTDTTGHGTALASTIVGDTCGLSDAQLNIVKIFDKNKPTLVSDLVRSFNETANHYYNGETPYAVLNLSWQIDKNPLIEKIIDNLIDAGMVVVCAAGNEGVEVGNVTPASMPRVITVAGFGQELSPVNLTNHGESEIKYTAGQTNYGEEVDCFGPGEHIRVASVNGGYLLSHGTSYSSAIVSSIFAMRMAASQYRKVDGEFDPMRFLRISIANGLLDLDSRFTVGQNVIPTIDLINQDNRVRQMRVFPTEAGTSTAWMFNNDILCGVLVDNPSWVQLDGNFIKIEAPESEGLSYHEFTLITTNRITGEQTESECGVLLKGTGYTQEEADHIENIYFKNNGASYKCVEDCMRQGLQYCCRCCQGSKVEEDYCANCSDFDCMLEYC